MHVSLLKWIEEQQETRKGKEEKKHWHDVGISPQNISVQRQPLFQLPNLTDSRKKGYLHEKQKSKIKPWHLCTSSRTWEPSLCPFIFNFEYTTWILKQTKIFHKFYLWLGSKSEFTSPRHFQWTSQFINSTEQQNRETLVSAAFYYSENGNVCMKRCTLFHVYKQKSNILFRLASLLLLLLMQGCSFSYVADGERSISTSSV